MATKVQDFITCPNCKHDNYYFIGTNYECTMCQGKLIEEKRKEIEQMEIQAKKWDEVCDSIQELRNEYIWFYIDVVVVMFVVITIIIQTLKYFF